MDIRRGVGWIRGPACVAGLPQSLGDVRLGPVWASYQLPVEGEDLGSGYFDEAAHTYGGGDPAECRDNIFDSDGLLRRRGEPDSAFVGVPADEAPREFEELR